MYCLSLTCHLILISPITSTISALKNQLCLQLILQFQFQKNFSWRMISPTTLFSSYVFLSIIRSPNHLILIPSISLTAIINSPLIENSVLQFSTRFQSKKILGHEFSPRMVCSPNVLSPTISISQF